MTPLLSIAVATRNRQHCARSLIVGLHESTAEGFELLISDNSDDAILGDEVTALGDPRIRYVHSTAKMNMHENFDRAIAHARGQYVCLLGDDDGILIEPALALVERARARDIDAVLPALRTYNWPGMRHWHWGDVGGSLVAQGPPLPERMLDPRTELAAVFATGVTRGLGHLPRVYQAIVRRRSLDALLQRCGTLFPGASPDMANAVALAASVNTVWQHPDALIISGHSPSSGGGAGTAGRHHGKLEDQPHLPAGTLEQWTPTIPRFWSGITIYAQSAVVAAERSSDTLRPTLNEARLYAACLVYERRVYWLETMRALRANPRFGAGLVLRVTGHAALMLVQRAHGFAGSLVHHRLGAGDHRRFADIAELMRALSRDTAGVPSRTAARGD